MQYSRRSCVPREYKRKVKSEKSRWRFERVLYQKYEALLQFISTKDNIVFYHE